MKKTIIVIFSLLISTINICAQTWGFVGLDSMVIKHLYVSGDTIYAGTRVISGANINSGLYYTTDGGNNWVQLDSALGSGTIVGLDYLGEGRMFLIKGLSEGSLAGNLYKSTNNGLTWEPINISSYGVRWIGTSPFNKNEIYAIDRNYFPLGIINSLFKSTDQGNTWEDISAFPGSSHGSEISFAFDLTDSMSLYVPVDTRLTEWYLYKSTDKGNNWFYVSTPPIVPTEIYTDYFIPNMIYLFPGPYVSTSSGLSWFKADSGFTENSNYLSFYQDRLTSKLLYILKTDGLYSTSNDTFYWSKIEGSGNLPLILGPSGFPYRRRNMENVFIDERTKKLYVGTSSGIYITSIITNLSENTDFLPEKILLKQNFPNPFNPKTSINYSLPQSGYVTLKVYDLLGNEILVLANEKKDPGNYEVEFNGENFSSGIYIYTISVDGVRISKKMILIK